ncbi:MAG: hypothetical protein QM760_12740 [Nibricoccus sp.]
MAYRTVYAEDAAEQPGDFRFSARQCAEGGAKTFPAESAGAASGEEGEALPTKILVLPSLPTAEPFRSQSLQLLKERGVDAIISFRAMLLDLIEKIEPNRSYGKSDTLQVIRILKNYDLLKDAQLDLPGAERIVTRKPRS